MKRPGYTVNDEQMDALIFAARVLERYEDPRMQPLSEEKYRTLERARVSIHQTRYVSLATTPVCNRED